MDLPHERSPHGSPAPLGRGLGEANHRGLPTVSDLAARAPGDSWETALRQAWDLLDDAHPAVAAEAAAAISVTDGSPRTIPGYRDAAIRGAAGQNRGQADDPRPPPRHRNG